MIISASRRTDIPCFYSDWFFKRLNAGFAQTRNPMNPAQVKTVSLAHGDVDCFVFWTKNPAPMLTRFDEMEDRAFYFQFTLNPYGAEIEPNLSDKESLTDSFYRLSEKIGPHRVIWRYDPVVITGDYSLEFHIEVFGRMARALRGYTQTCTISFFDDYKKIAKNTARLGMRPPDAEESVIIARCFSQTAAQNGMKLAACAEQKLIGSGIEQAHCIDALLAQRISGKKLSLRRAAGQRPQCGCAHSVDIGAYDTCANACVYCYACRVNNNPDSFETDSAFLDGKKQK